MCFPESWSDSAEWNSTNDSYSVIRPRCTCAHVIYSVRLQVDSDPHALHPPPEPKPATWEVERRKPIELWSHDVSFGATTSGWLLDRFKTVAVWWKTHNCTFRLFYLYKVFPIISNTKSHKKNHNLWHDYPHWLLDPSIKIITPPLRLVLLMSDGCWLCNCRSYPSETNLWSVVIAIKLDSCVTLILNQNNVNIIIILISSNYNYLYNKTR